MSRRQVVLLILTNALISLIISVVVVWVAWGRWSTRQPIYSPLPLSAATRGPTSPRTDILYIVQAGDSLSGIAARFQLSLDDLMRANGITNPDYISAGQRLVIPAAPLPTLPPTATPTATVLPFEPPTALPTRTATPASTPTETMVPSPSATASVVRATATLTVTPSATPTTPPALSPAIELQGPIGAGDLSQEVLLIANVGEESVPLTDWVLLSDGGQRYVFPEFSLVPGASVALHSGAGQNGPSDLYWGLDAPVWAQGKTITVLDRYGALVAELRVP